MVVEINADNFKEKVRGKCVVDFFATWCPPCKMLAPVLEEVSNEQKGVAFYKVNVDENVSLASEYGIAHVPTLILFENGAPKNKISGFVPKENLEKFIQGTA